MNRAAAWLLELFFPSKCILCGKLLRRGETDLCDTCRVDTETFPLPRNSIPFLASWRALWYYKDNVRQSLLRYKFSGERSYAAGYGRLLAMKLQQEQVEFDLLTWTPVSTARSWKRGYDQVALLAEAVGRELGVTPVRTLHKRRNNPPQSGITGAAARRANVLNVYEPVKPWRFAGKRVLLLDDIVTSGATVSECARVLLTAGAAEVHAAALAAANRQTNQNSR